MLNYCKHFIKLDNKSKCVWLMTTEDIFLVENVGHVTFYFYFVYAAFYRNCNAPTIAFLGHFPISTAKVTNSGLLSLYKMF